jgi:hypothetical protein
MRPFACKKFGRKDERIEDTKDEKNRGSRISMENFQIASVIRPVSLDFWARTG